MAIMYRDKATFLCVDDKHKVKVGEPGHPVAAVERGKSVLVGPNQVFQVTDHDFCRSTLTPSVILNVDIPEHIEDTFHHGKVCVGIKDSVFQASSPKRHASEIYQYLKNQDDNELLFLYSDGGPDHNLTFLYVQLSLIGLFLALDLDCLVAVRTPPGHSWKNPAERVMCVLNLGLQSVGVMRASMSNEKELLIKPCNTMKEIRIRVDQYPDLKEAFSDSLSQPISLLNNIIKRLKLKDNVFDTYQAASETDITELMEHLDKIDAALTRIPLDTKTAKDSEALKKFMMEHCQKRHYSFCIKKCADPNCLFHFGPRLPRDTFESLKMLPDPLLMDSGDHYKPFHDLYGSLTTEKDRPSLSKTPVATGHGMPFNPSAQTSLRVKKLITCQECSFPRVLHGEKN